MALQRLPILGHATIPDDSGNVFFEPYTVKATVDTWGHQVAVFNNSGTRIGMQGLFSVPPNFVSAATLIIAWAAIPTSGNTKWDFDYRAVGGDDSESFDQVVQRQLTVTDGPPSAINNRLIATIDLTDTDFLANDTVQFELFRDSGADTNTAESLLFELLFEYDDS